MITTTLEGIVTTPIGLTYPDQVVRYTTTAWSEVWESPLVTVSVYKVLIGSPGAASFVEMIVSSSPTSSPSSSSSHLSLSQEVSSTGTRTADISTNSGRTSNSPARPTSSASTHGSAIVQSPSSTASASNSAEAARLSGGAIAGIALGCIIAGFIVGAIAALCLLRRRQGPRPQLEYLPMQYPSGEKVLPAAAVPDTLQLDQFLLDSKPDAEIANELRALGQLIQQHVENNYHLQPVHRSPNTLAQNLVQLGVDEQGSLTAIELASLAIDPRTRWSALQHTISQVTFASIMLDGHSAISLLPPFAGGFVKSLPPIESHRGSSEAVKVALTRWRQLSAFLLHPDRSERTPLTPSEDVSTQQAQQLAAALNRFLEAFVAGDREARYEQENHLREVIVECATFGYLLFSQPSDFRFRYNGEGESNGIVTCPGLDKISNEEGRRYAKPYMLVAPVIEGAHVSHTSN